MPPLWPGTVLLGPGERCRTDASWQQEQRLGAAPALMTDRILVIALSSFLMLAHPRNGGEKWNLKTIIK